MPVIDFTVTFVLNPRDLANALLSRYVGAGECDEIVSALGSIPVSEIIDDISYALTLSGVRVLYDLFVGSEFGLNERDVMTRAADAAVLRAYPELAPRESGLPQLSM